ncbi:MAG: hypothetical protein ACYCQI_14500 [Gammaproteobacteria bacterium]
MKISGNASLQQLVIIILSLLFLTPPAYALSVAASELSQIDDPLGSLDKFNNNLAQIGITYKLTKNTVEITVDQTKALNSLPLLVSKGMVSGIDSKYVNIAPVSVSVILVGVASTINILNSIFERNNPDKLYVAGYLIPIGTKIKIPCYNFEYDREKFKMLDLGITNPRAFVKNTPQFTFSDWCKKNIDDEAVSLNIK